MNQSINKKQLIEIDVERYDELLKKEERLQILENAIKQSSLYSDIDLLKRLILKEVNENDK